MPIYFTNITEWMDGSQMYIINEYHEIDDQTYCTGVSTNEECNCLCEKYSVMKHS